MFAAAQGMMEEKPVTFYVDNEQVVGILHLPQGKGPHAVVLTLHGFTGNKSEQAGIARELAKAGIASFRFDLRGNGDSQGRFEEMRFEGNLADARAALTRLAQEPSLDLDRLGLLGHSMGGCQASLLAEEWGAKKVKALALWAPLLDLGRWIRREGFLPAPQPGKLLLYNGNWLDEGFVEELVKYQPMRAAQHFDGPLFIAHGDLDEILPALVSRELAETRRANKKSTQPLWLPQGDHVFSYKAEREELWAKTVAFFKTALANPSKSKDKLWAL